MTIHVCIQPPQAESTVREHDGTSVILGRAPSADWMIADQFLSRQHARLYVESESLKIEDLSSRNGTYVNGVRIQGPTTIRTGDLVQISETRIFIEPDQAATEAEGSISAENMIFKPATELMKTREFTTGSAWQLDDVGLRGYVQRLELLNEIHEALGKSMSLDSLLQLILDRVFQLLQPQQAVIFLKNPDSRYVCAAKRTQEGHSTEVPLSQSIVTEVAEKGMAALVFDMTTDKRFSAAESIQTSGIRSLVAAPLQDAAGSLGFIVLTSKVVVRQFSEDDMSLLASVASVAALKIRNVALSEEAAMRQILEKEISLARTIQLTLIPDRLPNLKGYQIAAKNVPSQAISGDYYETVLRNQDQECVFLVADVSGKGVAASLLTASLEALSASPIEDGLLPGEICSKLSRLLIKRTPRDRYATMFMAVLYVETGRLVYANAGHNPALLVRANGSVEWLERTGLPIGLMRTHQYSEGESTLEPGDSVLLYTDGLTEARNASGEEFGMLNLANACVQFRQLDAQAMASSLDDTLVTYVQETAFDDDRTYVLIKRT